MAPTGTTKSGKKRTRRQKSGAAKRRAARLAEQALYEASVARVMRHTGLPRALAVEPIANTMLGRLYLGMAITERQYLAGAEYGLRALRLERVIGRYAPEPTSFLGLMAGGPAGQSADLESADPRDVLAERRRAEAALGELFEAVRDGLGTVEARVALDALRAVVRDLAWPSTAERIGLIREALNCIATRVRVLPSIPLPLPRRVA